MTDEQRKETLAQADRGLRRGDLSLALRLYQEVATAFPHDEAVRAKLKLVQESLQPSELTTAKARVSAEPPSKVSSPAAEAERLATDGKIPEAIAAYRKLLEAQPQNALLQERLRELFAMIQAQAPRQPVRSPEARLTELLDLVSLRRRKGPPPGTG